MSTASLLVEIEIRLLRIIHRSFCMGESPARIAILRHLIIQHLGKGQVVNRIKCDLGLFALRRVLNRRLFIIPRGLIHALEP